MRPGAMKNQEHEAGGGFAGAGADGLGQVELPGPERETADSSTASSPPIRPFKPRQIPVVPIGAVIGGRYRVLELLGEGGMGQVFIAENMSIGLRVAIKVLRPELLAKAAFQTRFQREAQAIATIDHPNVVRFLDLVLGYPVFLVMELVRGPTLSELLQKEGQLDVRRAVTIAERLAWALVAVHAAGVIHRDLKPSNVIISKDRELGLAPKIIDFGVVRLASATDGQELTRVGQLVGTLHYVAPEQISSGQVDERADLYALGAVLYRMLAGRTPFADAPDESQLMYWVLEKDPPPLPSGADWPSDLPALLQELLAKSPGSRPRDAATVAERLKRIRDRLEPSSAPASPPRPRSVWRARLVTALIGAAVGAGILLGGRLRPTAPQRAQAAPSAMLLISTQPRGASVEIDGRKLSQTTPVVESGLSRGRHAVRLSLANHTSVDEVVDLSGEERDAIDVALAGASRLVEIQTTPRDATVFFNGQMAIQRTPVKIEVAADEFYLIEIEKMGYETLTARITPDDHAEALTFALEPERAPRGAIAVDSTFGGDVLIDGSHTGLITPTRTILLPAGAHTVEVRAGEASAVQHVNLRQGEVAHVLLEPVSPRRGR